MSFKSKRILLIDDNPQERSLLTSSLNSLKQLHCQISATSLQDINLEQININLPDLILLNVKVSNNNVFDFLENVRTKLNKIPIYLIADFNGQKVKEKYLKIGITEFINKPIIPEEITGRISWYFDNLRMYEDSVWSCAETKKGLQVLYRELEIKNEELKELNQLKSDFVSMVSHELRTPLTIIKERVSQIQEKLLGETTEKQEKALVVTINNILRLQNIINNLLDIAKIDSGKLELKIENINIIDLAKEIKENFNLQCLNKGYTLI